MDSSTNSKDMGMFLQDPSLRDENGDYFWGNFAFPLDHEILMGMGSSKLVIADPDFDGLNWGDPNQLLTFENFNSRPLERPIVDNPQFHQVNTFAVAAQTLLSFEGHLGREVAWKHGGPLQILPHGFQEANAYYDGSDPKLSFGFFNSPLRRGTVWTCLSHDIVAHELGHAILDSFRPSFLYSGETDTPAIHESLADLLALFTSLEHPKIVERLFRESDGDMTRPSVISYLAEEFGIGLGGSGAPYLRSALNGPSYAGADFEPHARSTVWTAAVYEIVCEVVELMLQSGSGQPQGFSDQFSQAVVLATRWVKGMLIKALHCMPPTGIMMPVLAKLMVEMDHELFPEDSRFREIAQRVFDKRGLWWNDITFQAPGIGPKLQDFDQLSPSQQIRLLYDHATELHIPLREDCQILTPKLVTVTRKLDPSLEGKVAGNVRSVTERYLQYSYAIVTTKSLGSFGSGQFARFETRQGGTLVMDENWNDRKLVNDPVVYHDDFSGNGDREPCVPSLQRALERFQKLNRVSFKNARLRHQITDDDLTIVGSSGHPFSVTRASSRDPFRVVWGRCNLADHIRGVGHTGKDCSFFSEV